MQAQSSIMRRSLEFVWSNFHVLRPDKFDTVPGYDQGLKKTFKIFQNKFGRMV